MSQFEKLWLGVWGLIALISMTYGGTLAWSYPDKLKTKLMRRAEQHPDWIFMKGYSLKFAERDGVLLFRLVTLVLGLILLASGILISLHPLGILK